MKKRWERRCGGMVRSGADLRETFSKLLKRCYGSRIFREVKRKKNEWWNEKIRRIVEKGKCFMTWGRRGREIGLEEYWRIKRVVRG